VGLDERVASAFVAGDDTSLIVERAATGRDAMECGDERAGVEQRGVRSSASLASPSGERRD
jgi:hypothetical protein